MNDREINLLIWAYHYDNPTTMGGQGIRRLVRYLPQFGIKPTVITACLQAEPDEQGYSSNTDIERVAVLDWTNVYRAASSFFTRKHKNSDQSASSAGNSAQVKSRSTALTTMVNRWLMIPDKMGAWRHAALRYALQRHKECPFDACFAALPPISALLGAVTFSRRSGVPLICQYRDLWTQTPYHHLDQPTAIHRLIHRCLESRSLRSSDLISCICPGIQGKLVAGYPEETSGKTKIHYNFFDPKEYPKELSKKKQKDRPFIVSYIGHLYHSRNPFLFFEGMRQFIDTYNLKPGDFRFCWYGKAFGLDGLDTKIGELELEAYIEMLGCVPHDKALDALLGSDVSLVIQADVDTVHLAGKLFEAMGARIPVLVVANPDNVMHEMVSRLHAGVACGHNKGQITEALALLYTARNKQNGWAYDEEERLAYSAEKVVQQMANDIRKTVCANEVD